ncbi:MAG: nickel pincer cofactor biosynthesis protein LarC [Candidatus Nezhaarchaeales archaeon]
MKALIIDPRLAGISGDMLLASLVDLTRRIDDLYQLIEELERRIDYCKKVDLNIYDVDRLGIRAKRVELKIDEDLRGITPSRFKANVENVLSNVDLSGKAKGLVRRVIDEILEAEVKVHYELKEVHEVASIDTIFDVIGVALLLDKTGFLDASIYATPPALGSGFIKTNHGVLPIPAPVTLEILRRYEYPYFNISVDCELTTPTGAALLVSLASKVVDFYPPMRVRGIGYGAGSRSLTEIPNVLRVIEGDEGHATIERVVVLETTVDDVTGEIMGHLFDKLFELGALDVMIIPCIGKKNRPANLIKVIAKIENYDRIVEALINELGTLGVRILEEPRIAVERSQKHVEIEIQGKKFKIAVKESKSPSGKTLRIKPEYEDLKIVAKELNMPLRRVVEIVMKQLNANVEI